MPVTRRTTGGTRARPGPAKGQSTLSFASRVTKPGTRVDTAKANKESAARAAVQATSASPEPSQEEPAKVDVVLDEEHEEHGEEEEEELQVTSPVVEKSDIEIEAEEVSGAQIEKYLKQIDRTRMAPVLHHEDLGTAERILRYFDVSSQYGPCIGMPRMKRWQRAQRLGLNPPIEVLAVLLQEQAVGTRGRMAYMDELMNPMVAGSA